MDDECVGVSDCTINGLDTLVWPEWATAAARQPNAKGSGEVDPSIPLAEALLKPPVVVSWNPSNS